MLAVTTAGCYNPSSLMILCCVVIVAVMANIFALGNMAFSFDSSVNFSEAMSPLNQPVCFINDDMFHMGLSYIRS